MFQHLWGGWRGRGGWEVEGRGGGMNSCQVPAVAMAFHQATLGGLVKGRQESDFFFFFHFGGN